MIDLDKIQEQLNNGWAVEADDIQNLVDYVGNDKKGTVALAYKVLVWMIHSGRFDNYKASEIRFKLNDIFGEEIMTKVKSKFDVA